MDKAHYVETSSTLPQQWPFISTIHFKRKIMEKYEIGNSFSQKLTVSSAEFVCKKGIIIDRE